MNAALKSAFRDEVQLKLSIFAWRAIIGVVLTILAGCAPAPSTESESSNSSLKTGPVESGGGAGRKVSSTVRLSIIEPERYGARVTVSTGPPGDADHTLRFDLVKIGADRRAVFELQAFGPAIYLEKSGVSYFIVPERRQYAELPRRSLLADLDALLNPIGIAERLRTGTRYESLSDEVVDGRTTTKFRLTRDGIDESFLSVDLRYNLPLRSEFTGKTVQGAVVRVEVNMSGVEMVPDAALFDVPSGFTKVNAARLAAVLESFEASVRYFADVVATRD